MTPHQQALHRKRLAYLRTFCGDGEEPHEDGRRVLADLKRFCGINRGGIVTSRVQNMVDPYATIYRAGLRDAYLRIVEFLNLSEDFFPKETDDATQTPTGES